MTVVLLVSIAGFFAQLIDGSMGMAFGIVSTTALIFMAYSPAAASAIVHLSEIVTSFINTAFEGGRHARRVAMLSELENDF